MNKKVPVWVLLLVIWGFCVIIILYGSALINMRFSKEGPIDGISQAEYTIASLPHLVKETFHTFKRPTVLVKDDVYPQAQDINSPTKSTDNGYILLSAFDAQKNQTAVKLISLQDKKIIHEWIPDYNNLQKQLGGKSAFWHSPNKNNITITHPLLLSDGSIIFNNMYSPLVKIDKDSKIVWLINGNFNHSQECDADGNIWCTSTLDYPKFLSKVIKDFQDDLIIKVSPDGKVIFTKAVSEILYENGYKMTVLNGLLQADILHVNDVEPALTSTKYWQKGDVLVSVRNKSVVFLYRPLTNKVIWLQTGPWLNQHDVDFVDSTRIGVFGNDVVRNNNTGIVSPGTEEIEISLNGHNQEYVYDFKTGLVDTPYSALFKNAKISTAEEGRSDILANGDLFVEETNNNRLLRGNKKDIIWQYVDRVGNGKVACLSWSRFITNEEFKKLKFLNN